MGGVLGAGAVPADPAALHQGQPRQQEGQDRVYGEEVGSWGHAQNNFLIFKLKPIHLPSFDDSFRLCIMLLGPILCLSPGSDLIFIKIVFRTFFSHFL